MEIDKLALLLEEVKRQSDRIQAVADAIGDRLLPDPPFDGSAPGSGETQDKNGASARSQQEKVLPFSPTPQ